MASRLTALALNCTLSPSPAESSTQLMMDQVLEALRGHDVTDESIRAVARTTATPAASAAHLARRLVADPYPGVTA